jgi:tetratricopeptide (TPR) repeat protein
MHLDTFHLSERLFAVTRGLLSIQIFFLPLFFLPFTLDILDLNKQTLLLVFTFTATLTWIAGMMIQRRFTFRNGWVNALLILFLIAVGISAWNSSAPFLSWVGGSSQEYTSFLTIAGLTILFYLITNTFNDFYVHRFFHLLLMSSALIAGIIAILSLFGFAQNTIGTINSTGIYLAVQSVFCSSLWISHRKTDSLFYKGALGIAEQVIILLVLILTFTYLLSLDYWLLWFLFVLGHVLLFVFVFFRSQDFSSVARFIFPLIFTIVALPFWFWMSSPISVKFPTEVSPSFQASTEISKRAFERVSTSFGSGPGTYLFVYAREHGLNVNQTDFFNTRFDRASSFYLTLLPTIGYVGVIAFFVFLFALGVRAIVHLVREKQRDSWFLTFVPFCPWILLVVAGALYPFNLTLIWLLFLLSALLASQVLSKPIAPPQSHVAGTRLLSSIILSIGSLAFLVGIFFTSQRYIAEIAFAKAVRSDRDGTEISEIVSWLDRSATLNRYDDRFYRALSQALLLRVNEQLATVSSAAELTQESRGYVQALVASAVNASVRATELSPNNALNWLMRGTLYRELVNLVPNASTFAIGAFEKSIELEPLSPSNWTEFGITYLAVAERERPLTASPDKKVAEQSKILVKDFTKKAETAFGKAIELKSNYAPAHYQLGITYERQGRLNEAIGKMESVARYNSLDVGVVFQLGQLYMRRSEKGDLARAKKAFEYAISLAPSYSNARWFLATIYEQEGNVKAAIEQLEKLRELNPDNQLVQSRLNRLVSGQTTSVAL